MKVDLHLHSWCSDGLLSPQDLLDRVVGAGIEVACFADHETAGGYLAVKDAVPDELTLIFGAEFSTHHERCDDCGGSGGADKEREAASKPKGRNPQEIHILGYFPNGVTEGVQSFLKELQQERVNRAKVALVNLRKNGCKIAFDQLMEHVRGDIISRAHMARALIANGLVSSTYEAFNRYLDISRGIVPRPLLTPKRAIRFIASEGGIPVWAHPELESFDLLVKEFIDCGLKGVEICTRRRSEAYSFYFERTARVLGLYVTYGSDWHGLHEENVEGISVPYESVAGFLEWFKRDRS